MPGLLANRQPVAIDFYRKTGLAPGWVPAALSAAADRELHSAAFCTLPSAVRGSASASTMRCGGLKRARQQSNAARSPS